MKILRFKDNEAIKLLESNIKSGSLVPLLGSGFTTGCNAEKGIVPTGKKMKNYMKNELKNYYKKDDSYFETWSFSRIAKEYEKVVDVEVRKDFLKKNFRHVKLDSKEKIEFINLDWKYVYTLNFDDGIECADRRYHKVLPMRKISSSYIEENKCVIKIHGDIEECLSNENDKSLVYTQVNYIKSIEDNKCLLSMLQNDLVYKTLIYIGCSLEDEIDLLSIDKIDDYGNSSNAIYLTHENLDDIQMSELKDYGVGTIIQLDSVENYNDFYGLIYRLYNESKCIDLASLGKFKNYNFYKEEITLESGVNYLLNTKYCFREIDKNNIYIPDYFMERNEYTIISEFVEMGNKPICIIGNRFSGKSYFLLEVIRKIKTHDVYYFHSGTQLGKDVFNEIKSMKNSIFVFDTNTLSTNQIMDIVNHFDSIESNKSVIIFTINSFDKDYLRIIPMDKIHNLPLRNTFTDIEKKNFNDILQRNHLYPYDTNITLLDFMLMISEKEAFRKHNPFRIDMIFNKYEIACFIMLIVKESITSHEIYKCDFDKVIQKFHENEIPVVDVNVRSYIEGNSISNIKMCPNAKLWIHKIFKKITENSRYYDVISDAFCHLVSAVKNDNDKSYMRYINFNTINELFKTSSGGAGRLIEIIYDKLENYLFDDPQFYHQRAKSLYILDRTNIDKIQRAVHFIEKSRDIIEKQLNIKFNKKLKISLDNVMFTEAQIYGLYVVLNKYELPLLINSIDKYYLVFAEDRYDNYMDQFIERISGENNGAEMKQIIDKCISLMNEEKLPAESISKVNYLFNILVTL